MFKFCNIICSWSRTKSYAIQEYMSTSPIKIAMDKLALGIYSKTAMNIIIERTSNWDDWVTVQYHIAHYQLLAVYTNINCEALKKLTTFCHYILLEVYSDYVHSKDNYDEDVVVLVCYASNRDHNYLAAPLTKLLI